MNKGRNLPIVRHPLLIAAATAMILLAAGCGSIGQKALTGTEQTTSTVVGIPSGWHSVQFGDAEFEIPSSWPVYDLSTDPTRCVRFDQHAAYLGHQPANATCPASPLGRTEAVQIEPLDNQSRAHLLPDTQAQSINGLTAELQPFSQTTHSLVAAFGTLGVVVTATWSTQEDIAEQILSSVHGR